MPRAAAQAAVGPQHHLPVALGAGEGDAFVGQPRAQAQPARLRREDQHAQLRHGGRLAHHEHGADALAVQLGDPAAAPTRAGTCAGTGRRCRPPAPRIRCSSRTRARRSRRAAAPPSRCRPAPGRAAPRCGAWRCACAAGSISACTVCIASTRRLRCGADSGASRAPASSRDFCCSGAKAAWPASVRRSRLWRASRGLVLAREPAGGLEAAQDAAQVAAVQAQVLADLARHRPLRGAPVRTARARRSATGRCRGRGRATPMRRV